MLSKSANLTVNEGPAAVNKRPPSASERPPTVVLIHGLASNRLLMLPLAWQIRRSGFRVVNHGYRSFLKTIPQHAEQFRQRLLKIEHDHHVNQFHIVAHSLGAIITRQLLLWQESADGRALSKLRRVVMLSPPNAGSPAADRLSWLLPLSQTVKQLSHRSGSYVRQLGEPEQAEIGIVEASYDFVIPKPTTWLSTQTDHVTVVSGHNGLLIRPTAAVKTIEFLRYGRFCSPVE